MDTEQFAAFKNRTDAGRQLAEKLIFLKGKQASVYAVPRGGIPIGLEVAKIIEASFNLIFVEKLTVPDESDLGLGALVIDGTVELNQEAIHRLGLPTSEVEKITQQGYEKLVQKKQAIWPEQSAPRLMLKTALLVDDGLISGYTMLAAIRSLKKLNPKEIIIAVTTASTPAVDLIKDNVKDVVSLYLHPRSFPFRISSSYREWQTLTDQDCRQMIEKHLHSTA